MNDDSGTPAVVDATVFSNFASTDGTRILIDTLPRPTTVPAVTAELDRGIGDGYDFLESARRLVDEAVAVRSPEREPTSVSRPLDTGEAVVLALALETDGVVVSDDADARAVARAHDRPVTGSVGVLARAVTTGDLSVETADRWLSVWVTEYGYRSPVESIRELLP